MFAAVGLAFAQPYDGDYGSGYWLKSYYVQVGGNVAFTNGDLNERPVSFKDSTGYAMKAYPPDISWVFSPDIQVGTNIRFFSLGVSFQYSSFEENMVRYDDDETTDVVYWRLGLEFVYNFLWPEDFQIGVGLGYAFSTLKARNSSFRGYEPFHTEYMGLGFGGIINAHYYFTDHIAIVPAVKLYENWFKNLYTKPSGSLDLDPYLWQTHVQISLSVQYKF